MKTIYIGDCSVSFGGEKCGRNCIEKNYVYIHVYTRSNYLTWTCGKLNIHLVDRPTFCPVVYCFVYPCSVSVSQPIPSGRQYTGREYTGRQYTGRQIQFSTIPKELLPIFHGLVLFPRHDPFNKILTLGLFVCEFLSSKRAAVVFFVKTPV